MGKKFNGRKKSHGTRRDIRKAKADKKKMIDEAAKKLEETTKEGNNG